MNPIKLTRINHETVEAVPLLVNVDKRPILGADLFDEVYANIFLCARKKSGKSSVIYNIIKKCANRHTTVIAFVSTLHKDDTWSTIQKHCEYNHIPFIGHTSLKGDRNEDILLQLINELQMEQKQEVKQIKKDSVLVFDDEHEVKEKRVKKSKFRSPEYLFIFDDLSNELKSLSLMTLIKKNRHFRSKIIISSQYMNDMAPSSRAQLDYFLIFKGITKEKLIDIYTDASVGVAEGVPTVVL